MTVQPTCMHCIDMTHSLTSKITYHQSTNPSSCRRNPLFFLPLYRSHLVSQPHPSLPLNLSILTRTNLPRATISLLLLHDSHTRIYTHPLFLPSVLPSCKIYPSIHRSQPAPCHYPFQPSHSEISLPVTGVRHRAKVSRWMVLFS